MLRSRGVVVLSAFSLAARKTPHIVSTLGLGILFAAASPSVANMHNIVHVNSLERGGDCYCLPFQRTKTRERHLD